MCRQSYRFHVMRGLFLVHAGISVLTPDLWQSIGRQVLANNRLFESYKHELNDVYGSGDAQEQYCNAGVIDRDGMTIHLPS